MEKIIPLPEKIRTIKRFGWIDHQLLKEGWLETMSLEEIAVYTFLVIAADQKGVSFYRKEKIAKTLSLDFSQVNRAVDELLNKNLIAFKAFSAHDPNGFYQVLNIPRKPVVNIELPQRLRGCANPEKLAQIWKKLSLWRV